jgi:hypothetical protein
MKKPYWEKHDDKYQNLGPDIQYSKKKLVVTRNNSLKELIEF